MRECGIIVVGAGPAGMAAALALAESGRQVCLAGPPPRPDDRRTTAIMAPGMAFLASLGVTFEAGEAAPLRVMRIVDATSRLVRSPTVAFRSAEIGEEAFGWNITNTVLNRRLSEAVAKSGAIERIEKPVLAWATDPEAVTITLDGGEVLVAKCAVAADGRSSGGREAAGIRVHSRPLPQVALVTTFRHAITHEDTSTELHTEHGPCTQVPLADPNRSSLVWVTSPDEADLLASLDEASFCLAVERRMHSMLGKVSDPGPRQTWPLSTGLPARFADKRIALVGESAHVFPPIGAQGLNLGLRDAKDLVSCLRNASDPGAPDVLNAYSARRRPDVLARAGAVNALNTALLSDFLPAQMARSAGLGLLRALSPLRSFFMREGMAPGSGFRRMGTEIRSLGKEVGGKISARDKQQQSGH
ncbi:2-octaprenyl-6-methoxyphenyl hydroxylase [Zhengella mangrovi]|uniref:2-octaprenyl-6-methoxyphenyl hydroxylase n=1 Tax=Zhengella mangrovi TaxID=1982044 RepID=A0A2G1QKV3_9HYPH|nr:UbiH/UbiF family hydroxylase [Zhengella mangrovi]PHP65838.1 2-octaprenyl-6-methoxyphenyl hydroxylase [Zhengella mangrovi]